MKESKKKTTYNVEREKEVEKAICLYRERRERILIRYLCQIIEMLSQYKFVIFVISAAGVEHPTFKSRTKGT